jgi:hypothetical protein
MTARFNYQLEQNYHHANQNNNNNNKELSYDDYDNSKNNTGTLEEQQLRH